MREASDTKGHANKGHTLKLACLNIMIKKIFIHVYIDIFSLLAQGEGYSRQVIVKAENSSEVLNPVTAF